MNSDINSEGSVLDNMKSNLNAIKSALNKERIFGTLAFPVMLILGLSFSKLREGESIGEVFSQEYNLISILVLIALILFWAMEQRR